MVLRKKDINQATNVAIKTNITKIKTNFGVSLAIIIGLLILTSVIAKSPMIAQGMELNEAAKLPQSEIQFNLAEVKAVEIKKIKPEIVPGESLTQKEIREKAEAEALKKAQQKAAKRTVVSRERRVYVDPSSLDAVYAAAQAVYGVDAMLLKAVHYVETGCSGSTTKSSYAGATGPMQFLPSTFNRHAVDGNNDGIKDVYNVEDAIFTAAAYLKACGYPDVKRALWGYNRSTSYYYKVIEVAKTFGMQI